MEEYIGLHHGDGGKHTHALIRDLFYQTLNNEILLKGLDSAVFDMNRNRIAMTTDSYVVKPLFFAGGDIGKLAVTGTVNDLAVSGARPLYLSAGFIIEEGFEVSQLRRIVQSMNDACLNIDVKVVTGDTKVVEKGFVEGVFINTAGIGVIEHNDKKDKVRPGDPIIVTGSIGEHGTVIALDRYHIGAKGNFSSDCASVYPIISMLSPYRTSIKLMKDPTRGGLAMALNEVADFTGLGIRIMEETIPIRNEVSSICDLLGIDPFYLACEGRALLIVEPEASAEILKSIRSLSEGKDACIIGSMTDDHHNKVYMETTIGGKRIIPLLETPMLPRIC